MAAMVLPDLGQLSVNGLLAGILSITRASQTENYFVCKVGGAFGNGFWYLYGVLNILLGFNRCVDLTSPKLSERFFAGSKTWLWVGACLLWATGITIYFLTPGADLIYHSSLAVYEFKGRGLLLNTINNWTVAISLPIVYTMVWVFMRRKMSLSSNQEQFADKERKVVLQAFIISFLTFVTAVVYVTFPILNIPANMFWLAQFVWQTSSGMNCLVYLGLNKTIRKGVLDLLGLKRKQRVGPSSTNHHRKINTNLSKVTSEKSKRSQNNAVKQNQIKKEDGQNNDVYVGPPVE